MNSKSIYADGGMNKQTGNVAWGCVVDREGNDLILSYIDGVWGQMSNYKDNEEKTKEMFYELLREFPGEDADKKAA